MNKVQAKPMTTIPEMRALLAQLAPETLAWDDAPGHIRRVGRRADALPAAVTAAERLAKDMAWFCKRVEAGEVRSVRTYERYRATLDELWPNWRQAPADAGREEA